MQVALPGAASAGTRSHENPASTALPRKRTVNALDALTLTFIALVVVLVSLPRLRRFAVRENETDALRMMRVLSASLAERVRSTRALAPISLHAAGAAERHVLTDLELLADGRLRRHGYLFELGSGIDGDPILVAWPWEEGRTGQGVFVMHPTLGLVGHPNRDGQYSGPGRPPTAAELTARGEWFALPRF